MRIPFCRGVVGGTSVVVWGLGVTTCHDKIIFFLHLPLILFSLCFFNSLDFPKKQKINDLDNIG